MKNTEQLVLPVISEAQVWERMLAEFRKVIEVRGNFQVAGDLDIASSTLSNCLAERNGNDFKAKHVPYFLRHRVSDDLPRVLVEPIGYGLKESRPLTAAERLERIEAALGRAGAAGAAILSDAFGGRR